MRKAICIIFCLIALFACIGCSSNSGTVSLTSGNYYAEGDYEELMTPYLWLDTKENRFSLGAGSIISYAETGTYEIVDKGQYLTNQNYYSENQKLNIQNLSSVYSGFAAKEPEKKQANGLGLYVFVTL